MDNRWASLDEQRLQVFEELTEARLAVGEHRPLLSEVRRHLAAHPLRERAWGQLMLALYRCGEVPAALTAYRDAHATLQEQLGIDPGEDLARLHRAVLDRSPDLAHVPQATPIVVAAAVPVTPAAVRVPRELPADLVTFVGRTPEVADVVAAVTGATPAAVVVSGPAGSGKSALAVRAAHAVAADFPEGQVFVDLGYQATVTADEVLARVLRALGVPAAEVPASVDERAGWVRSRIAGHRLLLVVDGVTGAEQVRPLIPAGPGPALIVVGQRQLRSLDGVRRVALGPVGAVGARALVAAFSGADRLKAEPAATAELVRLCAGSVLALRITGARLASRPDLSVAALVDQLRDRRDRLDLLVYEDQSVRSKPGPRGRRAALRRRADRSSAQAARRVTGRARAARADGGSARRLRAAGAARAGGAGRRAPGPADRSGRLPSAGVGARLRGGAGRPAGAARRTPADRLAGRSGRRLSAGWR